MTLLSPRRLPQVLANAVSRVRREGAGPGSKITVLQPDAAQATAHCMGAYLECAFDPVGFFVSGTCHACGSRASRRAVGVAIRVSISAMACATFAAAIFSRRATGAVILGSVWRRGCAVNVE
jgi:hypothetical protein